jgi:hypothetical protein
MKYLYFLQQIVLKLHLASQPNHMLQYELDMEEQHNSPPPPPKRKFL